LTDGAARFAARYPVVWHVIEAEGAGAWLSAMGLLPAAALFALAGLPDEGANRDGFQRLQVGGQLTAIVRPQLMQHARLLPTLGGRFAGDPNAWRRHINAHVFFWTEPRRRDAFIRACVRLRGCGAPPRILAIDSGSLLRCQLACAFFARINTGSTVRGGGRTHRDENTLVPVAHYRSGSVAELAIRGPVTLDSACFT
jgi:Family of unknown function (DUF7002)